MNLYEAYALAGLLLVGIGVHGVFLRRHMLRKIMALNVLSSGVFMIFLALAQRPDRPDPVPHAMVLTGIVVTVALTGFLTALARKMHVAQGHVRLGFLPSQERSRPDRSG